MSPCDRGQVADALDLELLLVALRHAHHHVVDQRPRQAVVGADLALLALARANDRLAVVVDCDADLGPMRVLELAELAFDGDLAVGDAHLDAVGHRNRFFANTGHV